MRLKKSDQEDIERGIKKGLEYLSSVSSEMHDVATSIKTITSELAKYLAERDTLYKVILSLMLDTGTYEYSIDLGSLDSLKDSNLDLEFDPDSEFPILTFHATFAGKHSEDD